MTTDKESFVVRTHDIHPDPEYFSWVQDIKKRFTNAQARISVKVNFEQLLFNWQLGRDIVVRKAEEKWGSGIVEQLSLDLCSEFPNTKGFSTTNLWAMKKWFEFYNPPCNRERLQQLAEEIKANRSHEKLLQLVGEFEETGSSEFLLVNRRKKVLPFIRRLKKNMHTNSGNKVFCVIMRRHRTSGRSSHSETVWLHGCGTLRCGQALSGTLRCALKRSTSFTIQPSTCATMRLNRLIRHDRLDRLERHGHPRLFQRSSTAPTAP